jgi:hypothetical protein
VVGPTYQVTCARVGPTWVMWSNKGVGMWQAGAEVTSCCAVMCQLEFDSLLMWVAVAVPCGISLMRWSYVAVPCRIG